MQKLARIEDKWLYLTETGEDRITANSIIITKNTLSNLYKNGANGIEEADNAKLSINLKQDTVNANNYTVLISTTGTIVGTIKVLLINGSSFEELTLSENVANFTVTVSGNYEILAYSDNSAARISTHLLHHEYSEGDEGGAAM